MHYLIYGLHDVGPHLVEVHQLADSLMQLRVIPVDAVVHYAIQIQVQVVYITALLLNQQISRWRGGTRGTPGETASLSGGSIGSYLPMGGQSSSLLMFLRMRGYLRVSHLKNFGIPILF